MTSSLAHSVLILGAGLTGLAAAFDLHGRGYRVTLLDHQDWRRDLGVHEVDGPALLLGCHQHLWRLITRLDPTQRGEPLPLEFRLSDGRIAAYRPARLPGSFQWIAGLLRFPGLTRRERWDLCYRIEQIWEGAELLPPDLESRLADDWLASIGQHERARKQIWNPLAFWLTGNALTRLSAATFVQQCRRVLLARASDARVAALSGSLEARLLSPLRRAAEEAGVAIRPLTEWPHVQFEQNRVDHVRLPDGTFLRPDWLLTALAHRQLLTLLPERLLSRYAYFAQIAELTALRTVSVEFTVPTAVPRPRLILTGNTPFAQVAITEESHRAACRLTAHPHPSLAAADDERLIELAQHTMRAIIPEIEAANVHTVRVRRDDYGGLSLHPGAAMLRPIQQSPISNLLVAGPWTETGWPSHPEGALVSAHRSVEAIVAQRSD